MDVAPDGEATLAACMASPPDLLITDLQMPGRRGESVIRKLRESHPEVPIMVITGESRLDTGRRAAALGVPCYVNKPLNLDDVARRVRELLTGGAGGVTGRLISHRTRREGARGGPDRAVSLHRGPHRRGRAGTRP